METQKKRGYRRVNPRVDPNPNPPGLTLRLLPGYPEKLYPKTIYALIDRLIDR